MKCWPARSPSFSSKLPAESTSVLTQWSNIGMKEKQENRDIRYRNVEQLCAVIREERAQELARVGLGIKCCQAAPHDGYSEERWRRSETMVAKPA